jgi:hypothetical protein
MKKAGSSAVNAASHSSSALRFADSGVFRTPSRPIADGTSDGSRLLFFSPALRTSLSFIRHPFRAYEKGVVPPTP